MASRSSLSLFLLTAAFVTGSISVARASTLVIVTDQAKAVKAKEVAALFQTTPPYSLMSDLKIKVIQTSVSKLGCTGSVPSPFDLVATTAQEADSSELLQRSESRDRRSRDLNVSQSQAQSLPPSCNDKSGLPSRLINCDTAQSKSFLSALKRTEKADYMIVVRTDVRYGGSGGKYPVITTGSPAAMAIHELMHRLGFADEYGYYTPCEADIYCPKQTDPSMSPSGYGSLPTTAYNVSAFNGRSNYSSNSDVRSAHAKQIPWLSSIAAATDLTNGSGQLGTPVLGTIGVYRAIVCDKASKSTETWQSTSQPTIMKTLATTYIPKNYWNVIAKSLGTHIN